MKYFTLLFLFVYSVSFAQITFPENGAADPREGYYFLTGATLHVHPDKVVEQGDLILRKGKIIEVGQNLTPPAGAVVYHLEGKHIYPSFIDLSSRYGIPEAAMSGDRPSGQELFSEKKGAFSWNASLIPEYDASADFGHRTGDAEAYRKAGIGVVLTHRENGIVQGSGVLTTLADRRPHLTILDPKASAHFSLSRAKSHQSTPTSQMGMIALLRQLYLDGEWYQMMGKEDEINLSLEAWTKLQNLPKIFSVNDKLEVLRAAKIAKEFNKIFIIRGAGDEYQRAGEIADSGMPLIIPVAFPEPYDVEDPLDAELVSLAQLKHWEWAPKNAAVLEEHDIPFAITSEGLKDKSSFLPQLRKAVRYGLSEKEALRSLTTRPAEWLGQEENLGRLEKGFQANLLITDGPIFEEKTKILNHWIQGIPYEINKETSPMAGKTYKLTLDHTKWTMEIDENAKKVTFKTGKNKKTAGEIRQERNRVFIFFEDSDGFYYRLNGQFEGKNLSGQYRNKENIVASFLAEIQPSEQKTDTKEKNSRETELTGEITYPFGAYGRKEPPEAKTYFIKNATIWTNTHDGIKNNTSVLIRDGKIADITNGDPPEGAVIIDAEGMHLTPGIIDEHSHIAISKGVNEASLSSSAAVRIGDVLNSEDINIYRQLAGGVTTSHILHGSANPIGGQAALIKLRWGAPPEKLKFEGADPFIKFALGENVKQSNWGERNTTRFPQTRMGVEQVLEDHFTRAEEYERQKSSGTAYRKNLEMETLAEILRGDRSITCHSYVQSEINMLLHLADRFGFRINTLTHILEGYKVADKIKSHGAAVATFSDWWAYKYEVIDAIPYNAALMHDAGLLTALNSDDAEMARRLHSEAGKTIKYGGMSEEEALKLVTLHPAKMLHIDDRVGKIETGMDADLVLWNGHPLSSYSRAEKTFVDGRLYFDRTENDKITSELRKERERLIQKMIHAKKNGSATRPAESRPEKEYHCDTLETE